MVFLLSEEKSESFGVRRAFERASCIRAISCRLLGAKFVRAPCASCSRGAEMAQVSEAGSSSVTPSDLHRVYEGTPIKVSKRKLIEITVQERKPVFRAKQVVNVDEVSPLDEDEVIITHRKLADEQEKKCAIADVFSPEIVIVVEALFLLQEVFDQEFLSLQTIREFADHVDVLVHDFHEEKPSFSRFCYGLWKSIHSDSIGTPIPAKGKRSSKRVVAVGKGTDISNKRAAIAAGVKLFVDVGAAVKNGNPENSELANVCKFSLANLEAWVELYSKKQERHISSHPFKFIGGNVEKAHKGLAVLEFIQNSKDYEILAPLIKASIPVVIKAIKDKEMEEAQLKEERGIQKVLMRSHLMNNLNGILEEFDILDI